MTAAFTYLRVLHIVCLRMWSGFNLRIFIIPGSVMKDFISDDHDHAISVSSLSVQIYTAPTLAHHLIANEDALFILLNTFLSECTRKCNNHGNKIADLY